MFFPKYFEKPKKQVILEALLPIHMNAQIFYLLLLFILGQASLSFGQDKAKEKAPEPIKVPLPCYQTLLTLEPVHYDTTSLQVPYQTFLFRYQREWLVLVADTVTFYAFTCKKVKTDLGRIDSLVSNSIAFTMNLCKLLDPKELVLKKKPRIVGDLHAPHYYRFSRTQQRLYASIQAAETGKVQTFIKKTWTEVSQFPKIFSFLVPKPNEKLQEQIKAMKDQAKKLKDEAAKLKDQATKMQENIALLQEEKKKFEEAMKIQAEKDKKEKAKEVAKDSVKNSKVIAKNNKQPIDKNNTTVKNNPKDSTKTKKQIDSLAVASTKIMTKQDSTQLTISKNMEKAITSLNTITGEKNSKNKQSDIDDLRAKQKQLLEQKAEFDHPELKKAVEIKVDNEKRKVELKAIIDDIDKFLKETENDKAAEIIAKRTSIKVRRREIKVEIDKIDKIINEHNK